MLRQSEDDVVHAGTEDVRAPLHAAPARVVEQVRDIAFGADVSTRDADAQIGFAAPGDPGEIGFIFIHLALVVPIDAEVAVEVVGQTARVLRAEASRERGYPDRMLADGGVLSAGYLEPADGADVFLDRARVVSEGPVDRQLRRDPELAFNLGAFELRLTNIGACGE